jgi:hypothetical protein
MRGTTFAFSASCLLIVDVQLLAMCRDSEVRLVDRSIPGRDDGTVTDNGYSTLSCERTCTELITPTPFDLTFHPSCTLLGVSQLCRLFHHGVARFSQVFSQALAS